MIKKDIITIIQTKFPKNGWALIRTRRMKPFSYIGYMLTIYSTKDDVTIIHEINGRTLRGIASKLLIV